MASKKMKILVASMSPLLVRRDLMVAHSGPRALMYFELYSMGVLVRPLASKLSMHILNLDCDEDSSSSGAIVKPS